MPVKRCPKCGEEKELTAEFWRIRHSRGCTYWTNICRKCEVLVARQWQIQNPDKFQRSQCSPSRRKNQREYQRKRKEDNPDHARQIMKKYDNSERGREKHKRQSQLGRDTLNDNYIKGSLRKMGIVSSSVTPDLIKLKRQQITMKRNLKQFKKWREERENESDHEYVSGEQRENEENYGRELQSRADSTGAARV